MYPGELYAYHAWKYNDSTLNFSLVIPGTSNYSGVPLHDHMLVLRGNGDIEIYFGNLLNESPGHNHTRLLYINGASGIMTRYKHGDSGPDSEMWLTEEGPIVSSYFDQSDVENAFASILHHCHVLGKVSAIKNREKEKKNKTHDP